MELVDRTAEALGVSPESLGRLVGTFGIIVLWVVLGRLARRVAARTVEDAASRFHVTRMSGYVIGAIALLVIAKLWVQDVTGVATYLGLVSAGIAIALQDPLTNLAGWLFILIRRPFRVGDRIQVGTHAGDVVDIRPFRFLMLEIGNWVHADQGTGRLLHVPNGSVFKNAVANYDEAFGFIWNEIEVTVTFESDWRKAKQTLEEILAVQAETIDAQVKQRIDAAAHVLHIRLPKVTPVVWTSVTDSGIRLTMRYLCKARARRSSGTEIWEKVLDAFAVLPHVDFAYPTTRRFDNAKEGKAPMPPTPREEWRISRPSENEIARDQEQAPE
jgi:small-conductance mechanosensitive channel